MPKVGKNIKLVLSLASKDWTVTYISSHLLEVYDLELSRQTINKFLSFYKRNSCLSRRQGSGRKSKVTKEVKRIVEAKMQSNDETTAIQLQQVMQSSGRNISLSTVKQCKHELGWTFHGSRYCQTIPESNKTKRLDWCVERLRENNSFEDVISSDESSIQIESHRRHAFRKKNQPPKLKPKPKLALSPAFILA